jgi:DNA-binding response OmpR family regulator
MKLRILIIEDDSIIALQIQHIIEKLDCICISIVTNSQEAFDIAKDKKIDFVISDINIDGTLDGIDTCKILQSKYNIDVLFLTAFNDIKTLKKASNINFVGYILKPFRQDELETIINLEKYKNINKTNYEINKDYSYDIVNKILTHQDKIVKLTKKEVLLLDILLKNKNAIVSYIDIESYVWNLEYVDEDTRRQLFHRFTTKVIDFPLELVKGVGYRIKIL